MSTKLEHQNFIDLMKAFGMLLIIFGHVIGDPSNIYNQITQPIHTKQIGVAFFVFITGWGLANDTRLPIRTVFNRIFPFYFYGIIFAVFMSVFLLFVKNDINASNYLPFFLGVNVLLDYFPANPTTWYIGTYLHILLFWYYFMQGKEVTLKHIIIALIIENVVRIILMAWEKDFIAYMLLPNWITIFLLGMYYHKKKQLPSSPMVLPLLAAWAGVFIVSTYFANIISFDHHFPFRNMTSDFAFALPVESILISMTYIVHTLFFFEIARRLPGHSIISFFARATLITVIIHMPIIYGTAQFFYGLFPTEMEMLARVTFIILLYVGTAFISEIISKFVDLKYFSNKSWNVVSKYIETSR